MADSGVVAYRGQQAGFLGTEFDPLELASLGQPAGSQPAGNTGSAIPPVAEVPPEKSSRRVRGSKKISTARQKTAPVITAADQEIYGQTRCGRLCRQARILVESGVRVVVVNLFDTLNEQLTWDCHGSSRGTHAGTVYDYRDTLGPQFDRAYAALIDDLADAGLLDETLVIATGEFGRTPRINEFGGRDHWTKCWSAVLAGGGIRGGQVIGGSDSQAGSVIDRPVHPGELVATVYHTLGISPDILLRDEQSASEYPLIDFAPVGELVA